jgi:hypothetical protein
MTPRCTLFTKFSKDYNQQTECPLFTLPAELRNRIFAIPLLSYDEDQDPGPSINNSSSQLPGSIRKVINTSLISTCRRIYLETHLVPLYINEHLFWCQWTLRLAHRSPNLQLCYFSRLTYSQRCAVERVHFFADMGWLKNMFPTVCNLRVMSYTKHLKITIRGGDWWDYDIYGGLHMKKIWVRNLVKLKNLEKFEVDLRWGYAAQEGHTNWELLVRWPLIFDCEPSTDTRG